MSRRACQLGLELAAAIETAAAAQGLDYVDVARLFGVRPHYVRRLFRGEVAASVAQLEVYALALGCELVVGVRRVD